jgi:cell division septation protein DedD
MPNQNKNVFVVIALLGVLGIAFFLMSQKKESSKGEVRMQDVFSQNPAGTVQDSDPVPSPAIVTSPVGGEEAGYAVQVYSFKDQGRANAALLTLKDKGFNAYIEMSDLGPTGVWYRVRIGGLGNEVQAQEMLETIRKNFNSGILIKPKV